VHPAGWKPVNGVASNLGASPNPSISAGQCQPASTSPPAALFGHSYSGLRSPLRLHFSYPESYPNSQETPTAALGGRFASHFCIMT
jgi:hypothetical protein